MSHFPVLLPRQCLGDLHDCAHLIKFKPIRLQIFIDSFVSNLSQYFIRASTISGKRP
jgi:hypothetical protein